MDGRCSAIPMETTSTCRSSRCPSRGSARTASTSICTRQDQQGEVARLLELGAVQYPRTPEPGDDFVTLQDPEGNLFDVIDKSGG